MSLMIRPKHEIAVYHAMLDEETENIVNNAKAESTKKSYQSDWADFESWCAENGHQSMPAEVRTVVQYLTARISHSWTRLVNQRKGRGKDMRIVQVPVTFQPLKPASIERKLSAISKAHQYAEYSFDRKNVRLAEFLKGMKRKSGTAQTQKAPILLDDVKAMTVNLKDGVQGIRDHALLLTGFVAALRRSEIVNLNIEDLKENPKGFDLTVRFSKTDQEGRGKLKIVPYGSDPQTCPVRALNAWKKEMQAAGIESGPLFRAINRHGQISSKGMCSASVALIIKRNEHLEGKAGEYGGHSLRAGFCTQSALNGTPDSLTMQQSGHKDFNTFSKYVRGADMWKNGAAKKLGL